MMFVNLRSEMAHRSYMVYAGGIGCQICVVRRTVDNHKGSSVNLN